MEPITLSYTALMALMSVGVAYGLALPETDEEYWDYTDSLRRHLQVVDEEYLEELEKASGEWEKNNSNKPEDEKEPFKVPFIPGLEEIFRKVGEEVSPGYKYVSDALHPVPMITTNDDLSSDAKINEYISKFVELEQFALPLDGTRLAFNTPNGLITYYLDTETYGSSMWSVQVINPDGSVSGIANVFSYKLEETTHPIYIRPMYSERNLASDESGRPTIVHTYLMKRVSGTTGTFWPSFHTGELIMPTDANIYNNPEIEYDSTKYPEVETDPDTGEQYIEVIPPTIPIPGPETIPGNNPDAETGELPLSPPINVTYPEPDPEPDPGTDPDTPTNPDVPSTPSNPDIPIIPPILPDNPGDDLPEGDEGTEEEADKDKFTTNNSGGLYYYYIGTDVSDSSIDDVIGHATGVVSLSYTPYLWYSDCNITKLPYDKDRFNNVMSFSDGFSVYRINEVTRPIKKVGGFNAYDNNFSVNTGEGKPYNYMNETKLYQYPYSFAYVYDGINNPLEIKYHYLPYVYNDVYIKQTVSDKCTYGIFVKDYKGDKEGNLESMVLTSGNELPCSSSTYAQWFATNRNQMAQNIQNVLATNAIQSQGAKQQYEIQKDMSTLNMIGGLAGALGSLFTYNIGGVGTGLSAAFNTANMLKSQQVSLNTQLALNKQSDQNAIQSAMALNNDMRNAPSTLVSHGSNVFYGILNNNKQLLLLRMGLSEIDYFRIGTYFTMYGYKQNRLMDINLRSRKYFNYFKITVPNIVSASVPHNQIEKIKEIFKEGVTLWHYNNSDKILNYFHSDNYEV